MPNSPTQIELITPDDWHLHIRDGEVMKDVLADTARQFARAIIMPNLKPPAGWSTHFCTSSSQCHSLGP